MGAKRGAPDGGGRSRLRGRGHWAVSGRSARSLGGGAAGAGLVTLLPRGPGKRGWPHVLGHAEGPGPRRGPGSRVSGRRGGWAGSEGKPAWASAGRGAGKGLAQWAEEADGLGAAAQGTSGQRALLHPEGVAPGRFRLQCPLRQVHAAGQQTGTGTAPGADAGGQACRRGPAQSPGRGDAEGLGSEFRCPGGSAGASVGAHRLEGRATHTWTSPGREDRATADRGGRRAVSLRTWKGRGSLRLKGDGPQGCRTRLGGAGTE